MVANMSTHVAEVVCEALDFACRMDVHEGQAAWVQAVGSVLAILISAAIAMWLPLRERERGDRAAAKQSKQILEKALALAAGTLVGLRETVNNAHINSGTGPLLEVNTRHVRLLLDSLPRHVLGHGSLSIVTDLEAKTVIFNSLLNAGIKFQEAGSPADELPFDDVIGDLNATAATLDAMLVRKIDGQWMLELPEDHPEFAA